MLLVSARVLLLHVLLGVTLTSAEEDTNASVNSTGTEVGFIKFRPKYAKVADVVETVWQRPQEGVPLQGIVFLAHDCGGQATHFFSNYEDDGWEFEACKTSNFGRCLGLPEERAFVRTCRERGYMIMAVSASSDHRCWDKQRDPGRVRRAINHVIREERLRKETPVFAAGAANGGLFLGSLVETGFVAKNVVCMCPIVTKLADVPNKFRSIPTVFIHMPKDQLGQENIEKNVRGVKGNGQPSKEIKVREQKLTEQFLQRTLSANESTMVIEALRDENLIDGKGFLQDNPKRTRWREAVKNYGVVLPDDTLQDGESGLVQLLDLAWGEHAFTSQYTHEFLDFCELMTEDAEAAKAEL